MNGRRSTCLAGLAVVLSGALACGSGGSDPSPNEPSGLTGNWFGEIALVGLPDPLDDLLLDVDLRLEEDDLAAVGGRVLVSGFGSPVEAPVSGMRMGQDVSLQADVSGEPRFDELSLDGIWDGADGLSGALTGTAVVLGARFDVFETLDLERRG